tara:strand:- start:36 stop:338 length:303 start_codon:yes stop_codon:yes gene_type:complete
MGKQTVLETIRENFESTGYVLLHPCVMRNIKQGDPTRENFGGVRLLPRNPLVLVPRGKACNVARHLYSVSHRQITPDMLDGVTQDLLPHNAFNNIQDTLI